MRKAWAVDNRSKTSSDADEELTSHLSLSLRLSECKWVFYSIAVFPIVPLTCFISWDVCTRRRERIWFGTLCWLPLVSSWHINSILPLPLCIPQKVSLGSDNESLFDSRRAEVIDSGHAALCFLDKESNMAAPAARATSLTALSPFRYHPHPSCSLKALFLLCRSLKRAPTNLI